MIDPRRVVRPRVVSCMLVAALCLLHPSGLLSSQFFGGDPLPFLGCSGRTFVFNTFMRVQAISPGHLHTGIDLWACDGDVVCPPIFGADSALVAAIGHDTSFAICLVPNRPDIRQEGKTVGCFLHWVRVSSSIAQNDTVTSLEQIGEVAGGRGHLHEVFSCQLDSY
jgi:hypothetical protein